MEEKTTIQFWANKDLMKKIQRLKELAFPQNPEVEYNQLFSMVLKHAIDELDPPHREVRKNNKSKVPR